MFRQLSDPILHFKILNKVDFNFMEIVFIMNYKYSSERTYVVKKL